MTIQEKENALFESWKQGYGDSFNEDGVIDPDTWETITPKIVFVLKETNGLNGDLRRFLRDGGSPTYHRTWNNIVRWAEVVLFDEYSKKLNNDRRKDILSHICAINLKKESGGAKAKKQEVKSAAMNDKEFIKKQLALYQPDIVIACGFELSAVTLRDIVDPDAEWRNDVNQLYYYSTKKINMGKPIYVISMPHPNRAASKWGMLLRDLYHVLKDSEIKVEDK